MQITKTTKTFLLISSAMMAISIIIGVFGAHGLKSYLDEYGIIIYAKASSYQFYNTLGLFAISFISYLIPISKKVKIAFYFILIGIFIFSFSLYILAITKIVWLGAITPIGGSFMIIGWLILCFAIKNDIKYLNFL